MTKEHDELMELTHEEVPGYRKIFFFLIICASIYLAVILASTL